MSGQTRPEVVPTGGCIEPGAPCEIGHPRLGARLLAAALTAVSLLAAAPAAAEGGADASGDREPTVESDSGSPDSRSADDAPAEPNERPDAARETSIHGGWLVIVSYIALWLLLVGFVAYLGFRQRELAEQLDGLESRIDETLEHPPDEE